MAVSMGETAAKLRFFRARFPDSFFVHHAACKAPAPSTKTFGVSYIDNTSLVTIPADQRTAVAFARAAG